MATNFNLTDDPAIDGFILPHLIESAVSEYLDKTALICANTELTYRELNAQASRLASALAGQGVGQGDIVGVALDRSIDLVVTLVAVLRSGAAYVPIDPTLPAERMSYMIEDAAPKLIIGRLPSEALASTDTQCLSLRELLNNRHISTDNSAVGSKIMGDDIAYVIYTSGSTGKPKGVEISHKAISNFVLAMQKDQAITEESRLLAIANISFDVAAYELFVSLICGATIVIAQTDQLKDPKALLGLVETHAITTMSGTPTTWQMLLDAGWRGQPRLKDIMASGEKLSHTLTDRLLDYADAVWNQYGPAEATVFASVWRAQKGEDVIIGNPISNVQLYVLGPDLSPVPLRCTGELYIGGAGLASGYRNNTELTKSKFLDSPFHPGGRIYCTGDVARFETPQRLSLLGRSDGQVKINGQRLEIGDIETAIMAHESVSAAVVVLRQERLIAYYTRTMSATADEKQLKVILRQWLTKRLPAYMVPAFFVEIGAFQVSHNGKIDRSALKSIEGTTSVASSAPTTSIKINNEIEKRITEIWATILGHSQIDIDDSFFHIGGDSVRVVRVQAQLENVFGRTVSTAKLFEHHTIRMLASFLRAEDQPQRKEASFSTPANQSEDIAIVSVSCRFPGGIETPDQFWELLSRGEDVTADVPKDRWDAEGLYADGKSSCHRGGLMNSPIDSFDASFFGISPREARDMDPMQYMMLETTWEAFERAGYTSNRLRGSNTGVYIGISDIPAYRTNISAYHAEDLDGYKGTGSAGSVMSGRVSYALGLEGPSLTVDTACSSSLVATHLACSALRQGECDMAIAGGVTLMLSPGIFIEFSRLGGMSSDGRCNAFSADAQGTGWSEGSAAVILKRLSDAQRDNDSILGVIKGTAVNHSGRSSPGLTVPSGAAQSSLIRKALLSAALHSNDIDYVEAHGTATKLGDPIEGMALGEVFQDRSSNIGPLYLGSVKSNLGHTQAAAGLAGLLKVLLSLRHNIIPKTLNVSQPTPEIDWRNMSLVQSKQSWKPTQGRPRRAGISAFGIGGTNAHVVVQEAPASTITKQAEAEQTVLQLQEVPVLLSGHSHQAVYAQVEKLLACLRSKNEGYSLTDVAYSLATTRNHFRHRIAVLARNREDLLDKLANASIALPEPYSEKPCLALLFTGQVRDLGRMGKDLARRFPVFRDALYEITTHFDSFFEHGLLSAMWADRDSWPAALLQRTDYAQPALFALQVALWRLWESFGVRPEAVLGHSAGELAAAHVAGVIPGLTDACKLVAARGRLMHALPGKTVGVMASIESSAEQVSAAIVALELDEKACIAAYNSPKQTVVSGDIDAVKKLAAHFAALGCRSKNLESSQAFHSHQVDGMLKEFQTIAETISFHSPTIPFVSTLTGKAADPSQLANATYWVSQARNPVRYSDGIHTLSSRGINIFLELGPQPVLCGLGATCMADSARADSLSWSQSLHPKRNEVAVVTQTLTAMHTRHAFVNWSAYFHALGCTAIELPTYAFQRENYGSSGITGTPGDRVDSTRTSRRGSHGSQTSVDSGKVEKTGSLRQTLLRASRDSQGTIMLSAVREAVAKALGFGSPDSLNINLSLQDIGVDSLTAVMTRNQLANITDLKLPVRVVFDHPNLRALSQFLLDQVLTTGLAANAPDTATTEEEAQNATQAPESTATFDLDAIGRGCLDSSLEYHAFDATTPPNSVLVTGATGFVGAFLVHELLAQGLVVYCLVRASSDNHAKERVIATLESYDLWEEHFTPSLKPVVGDITQPLLGLTEVDFNDLADQIDAICHSGAVVDWMRPLEYYVRPNILSTHEVLRLASRGRDKTVHLISTTATVPRHMGHNISEDDFEGYGYANSKFIAEKMITAARWRGACASVYRMPFITASASNGSFRSDRGDFLHNLITGSIDMGSFPSINSNLAMVLPVDYLAKTVVHMMARDPTRLGQDFDFSNAHGPTFNSFFRMMIASGAGEKILPFTEWKGEALNYAVMHPTSPLARIAAVLDGCNEDSIASLFRTPILGAHVLGGHDHPAPSTDAGSVSRYVNRIRSV